VCAGREDVFIYLASGSVLGFSFVVSLPFMQYSVFYTIVAWLLWCSIWMSLFYFERTPFAGLVHVIMDHSQGFQECRGICVS
jgi:hypothetical protein